MVLEGSADQRYRYRGGEEDTKQYNDETRSMLSISRAVPKLIFCSTTSSSSRMQQVPVFRCLPSFRGT